MLVLPKLSMYCKFKKTFELEKYIVTVKKKTLEGILAVLDYLHIN